MKYLHRAFNQTCYAGSQLFHTRMLANSAQMVDLQEAGAAAVRGGDWLTCVLWVGACDSSIHKA